MHNQRGKAARIIQYVLLVFMFVILIGPMIWQLMLAVKGPGDNIYSVPPYLFPKDFTFANFTKALNAIPILTYTRNSAIVAIISVCGNVIGSTLAGYALARLKFKGKGFVTALVFACMMIPVETVIISQFLVIRGMHLQNTLLAAALPGLIQPINVMLMTNAFRGVPYELEEAAKVDGANVWQRFLQICVPQVIGTATVVAIFSFVGAWNDFLWPLIVLADDSTFTLTVGMNRLRGTFFSDPRLIAAGTVLALIPIIIFFLVFQRYFFRGVEQGGVKG
ncbi:carbohydrate ABC transporter permease [Bifidobacterium scaligerum]|uniref:ABC transporter permease n=1 Tax=Bifidobacterium scaligerum TaxID=2052656 RepID=A0A2M9HS21_9BIFI|nr:carbohydrate ABC transporter permease [Bifidobacterium scaligerum]PJM79625.1 ABC transporter permease [Bifidobacterium scaligerum]